MLGRSRIGMSFVVRLLYTTNTLHHTPPRCPSVGFVRHAVSIPMDRLHLSFSRSSGPGGQNVNKLNTKAELRFNVHQADWIPEDIRLRLIEQQCAKINKDGDLILTSQEHRTQGRNREVCIGKLKHMLELASVVPKERNMWEDISEKGKEKRKQEKRHRAAIKQNRQVNDWD